MALLELKEISKEYSGKKVLDTVSLKIQSGDMKVVMGHRVVEKRRFYAVCFDWKNLIMAIFIFTGEIFMTRNLLFLSSEKKLVVSSRITLCIAILTLWITLPLPYVKCLACRDN